MLYILVTKSKSSASAMIVSSVFLIHLINDPQFLNTFYVIWCPIVAIKPFREM